MAAKIITEKLYQTNPENLTENQKQTVSALSQLASGLAGGLVGDSTSSAISAAEIGKRAVENNSLLVDQFRAAKKADAESWKQNVRDIFGEGATSQLINGAINVIEETSDGALFLIDGGFDTLATITTCAVKDSYCDQAKQDLSSKNQVISDAVNSLMNGSYWNAIQTTAIQAYQGDQKALEDISGLIIGVLTPTVKGISKKGTLDNFAYRVSEELDSTKHLPIVGESLGYENQVANISISRGAENIALYPKLKEQLIQENLMNIVKNNPILEHAAFGNGNLTTPGIVDKKVLDNLAKDWVGENYKINSDGSFVSADGTRRYRPPKLKKYSPYAKTGIQANFERGYMDNKQRFHSISNQHINVKE
ncbi:hypothetical protein P375_07205 [Gallibacterium genomosp. 2]|uniref:VENN motif-containing domain-containing protein n=1 Tax=Gallibacterium genomosp. 2 TaxID=155517 RepID=A0A0A2Y278_9PAST|nr:VENN motif pre-toxin domain-containing protein [Gallibacterium genomosp. 2]KGQ31609.1 hypothetical protein P375_07205 [Gallibacterium genomosp. 2]